MNIFFDTGEDLPFNDLGLYWLKRMRLYVYGRDGYEKKKLRIQIDTA
jgi:hypothetical protein